MVEPTATIQSGVTFGVGQRSDDPKETTRAVS
jgi:hypothetical protein